MKSNSACNNYYSNSQKSFCLFICFFIITSISAVSLRAQDSGLRIKEYLYEHTPSYGNYCGPLMTYGGPNSLLCPPAIDDIDAACAAHDYLYSHSLENDYFPRALADLKLTGSFLTIPATTPQGFGYSTLGSLFMPLQSIYWTALGTKEVSEQWYDTFQSSLKEYQNARNQQQQSYHEQQDRYYSEIFRVNNERYRRIMTVIGEREADKAKQAFKYWSDYYDTIMKETDERESEKAKQSYKKWRAYYDELSKQAALKYLDPYR